MKYSSFFIVFLFLCFTACKKEAASPEKALSFPEFYEKFHNDSLFQLEHIQFPLEGLSSDPSLHTPEFRWLKDEWQLHQGLDTIQGAFTAQLVEISKEFIVEKITDSYGLYGMERRFMQLENGKWLLIYYSALMPLETF